MGNGHPWNRFYFNFKECSTEGIKEDRENGSLIIYGRQSKSSSSALVMVKRSRSAKSVVAAPISIDYMGAKISIDESAIESVFIPPSRTRIDPSRIFSEEGRSDLYNPTLLSMPINYT